nr:putative RNA-directed DNA polymerase [Tanacetum cinerariifolium]
MLVIKIFSERKKVFREGKMCEKIHAKRSDFLQGWTSIYRQEISTISWWRSRRSQRSQIYKGAARPKRGPPVDSALFLSFCEEGCICILSKYINLKIKIHDQKHAKGTSKEFPSLQGSKTQDVIRTNQDWPLKQFGVKNAFLNGYLEEVYKDPPPGVKCCGKLCRLKKALYGLKQSPWAWFRRFSSFVKKIRYKQSDADHTLFVKNNGKVTALIVYVDDMVVTGNDLKEMTNLQTILATEFELKDLRYLKYFLGIEVARSKSGISMCQRKCVLDLLTKTGLLDYKPIETPIEMNHKLSILPDQVPTNKERYQRLVGKLKYLSHTRPDIAYAIGQEIEQMESLPRVTLHLLGEIWLHGEARNKWWSQGRVPEAEFRGMAKDHDISILSKYIKLKIKIHDQKHAKGTSKEFLSLQGSKTQDVIRTNQDWPLKQFDVKNAFLNGYLKEVYKIPPPGVKCCGKLCRLKKALYGLKQSPRAWFRRFSSFVKKIGACFLERIEITMCVGTRMQIGQEIEQMESLPRVTLHLLGEIWLHGEARNKRWSQGRVPEAEFRGMVHGVCELIWLKRILKDLGINLTSPMLLHCDNQAAVKIANNPIQHDSTKDVEIDRHFIKDHLEKKTIELLYVASKDQIADMLTKAVCGRVFQWSLDKLGMIDIHVSP